MDKEIVKACIKYKNHLFTGFDHGECFENLLKEEQPKDMTELEQGFIDNELNFVDRKNAMEIANNAGQLKFNPVKETLISEDLHLDWLNRQAKQIADLEAKLDEKTRVAEGYSELFDKRQHENYEQFCEIQELKAKLAEKEKEIKSLRTRQFIDMTEKEMLELKIATHKQDLKQIANIYKQSENQTAIAELKKVKQEFNGAFSISIQQEMFDKYINQQIKSLKGDK